MRQAITVRHNKVGRNQENQSSPGARFLWRLDRIYLISSFDFSVGRSRKMGNSPEVALRGITKVIGSAVIPTASLVTTGITTLQMQIFCSGVRNFTLRLSALQNVLYRTIGKNVTFYRMPQNPDDRIQDLCS